MVFFSSNIITIGFKLNCSLPSTQDANKIIFYGGKIRFMLFIRQKKVELIGNYDKLDGMDE